jgi:hypothetical protein
MSPRDNQGYMEHICLLHAYEYLNFGKTVCKSYELRLVSLHKIENNSAYTNLTGCRRLYDESV